MGRDISIFLGEVQPIFVETSQLLAKSGNRVQARDYLIEQINKLQAAVYRKISDEKVVASYVEMYKYNPTFREYFSQMIDQLTTKQQSTFEDFVISMQEKVMRMKVAKVRGNTSYLGEILRNTSLAYRERYNGSLDGIVKPADEFLSRIITKSDAELLVRHNLSAPSSVTRAETNAKR